MPPRLLFCLLAPGIVLVLLSRLGAQVIDWDATGWVQNQAIGPEVNPYFDTVDHVLNPYSGLASSSGGVTGFASQTINNIAGSGVDMTVYLSRNNYDGSPLEGLDLYAPSGGSGANPDRRVTGDSALRVTRDRTLGDGIYHPVTVVVSFSQAVTFEEFIFASLSTVGSSNENVVVRAFGSADATGPVIKASEFRNISNLSDGSSLLHNQWDPTGPVTNNAFSNVAVDPDLTIDGSGNATNVGGSGDDGIYHIIGIGAQNDSRYGRVALGWDDPVQSVAASFFPSASADFNNYNPTSQWVSGIFAPLTFTPTPEPGTAVLLGLGLLAVTRRRR